MLRTVPAAQTFLWVFYGENQIFLKISREFYLRFLGRKERKFKKLFSNSVLNWF